MDEQTFRARLAGTAAAVEQVVERRLAYEPSAGETARPRRLIEAMRYATLGGGKRLRPFLVVETARALGRSDEAPVMVGAAIECVHAYSLIHDDLPAMDDDAMRRGRPTTHRAFDEATAILAGDALQALAFEILADPRAEPDAATRAALCAGLARAAGLAGMVGGQMLDIEAETVAALPAIEAIRRLQAMKTGAMLAFSVEAGAILAGTHVARAPLTSYGRAIGAAFQVADDLLDAEGDEATLGKQAGKDAGRHKATLVAALGVGGARNELVRLVAEAKAALDSAGLGERDETLRAAADFVAARRN
jgi:farnesyl diphosphate synthase